MIYGGRREPKMEVDLWEGDNTAHVLSKIDNIRQVRGRERNTGESLSIAAAKVSYHYCIYDWTDAIERNERIILTFLSLCGSGVNNIGLIQLHYIKFDCMLHLIAFLVVSKYSFRT